ncbi:hypothetical protein [Enterobacter kobei]|nr:hypothetical protein [Enterobacter kobei]
MTEPTSLTTLAGNMAWCALVALHLARMDGVVGEPAEFGKNRTLRFSGHP